MNDLNFLPHWFHCIESEADQNSIDGRVKSERENEMCQSLSRHVEGSGNSHCELRSRTWIYNLTMISEIVINTQLNSLNVLDILITLTNTYII